MAAINNLCQVRCQVFVSVLNFKCLCSWQLSKREQRKIKAHIVGLRSRLTSCSDRPPPRPSGKKLRGRRTLCEISSMLQLGRSCFLCRMLTFWEFRLKREMSLSLCISHTEFNRVSHSIKTFFLVFYNQQLQKKEVFSNTKHISSKFFICFHQ